MYSSNIINMGRRWR